MIQDIGGRRAWVAVISSGRPANVKAMTSKVGPATWYVGCGELGRYTDARAPAVVEGGALCKSRNAALRDAWGLGLPCVQVSDDLGALRGVRSDHTTFGLTFEDVVGELLHELDHGGHLAGVAPTDNAFFYGGKPLSTDRYIVGDLVVMTPCDVWFDEELRLKEDYDCTLAHLVRYGLVKRRNDLLASFAHRTNRGGAVAYRTSAVEQEAIAYLQAKWPGCLRPNPRRANELLMQWPPKPVASVAS